MELLYEDKTYLIIGAAMAVHQELGHGFLEAVFKEALEKEFNHRNIPEFIQEITGLDLDIIQELAEEIKNLQK